MHLLTQMKQKTMLILILATCILCLGFIIISCGTDPQLKITDPDTGQFAVDFSACPDTSTVPCKGVLPSSSFTKDADKKIEGKELTIEAWVKNKAATDDALNGGIFARFDNSGIALYAKDGIAKAVIRRVAASGTATATADYIVTSGVTLLKDAWNHVAAVLANSAHSHPANDCDANDADDNIHLDIFINGTFEGCAATFGASNDPATDPGFAGEPFTKNITIGEIAEGIDEPVDTTIDHTVEFLGVVDEARLWGVARTSAEIQQCKDQELSNDDGICGRRTDKLISYIRLNEGMESTVNDWAGLGAGGLEYRGPNIKGFVDGWVPGAPITKHD